MVNKSEEGDKSELSRWEKRERMTDEREGKRFKEKGQEMEPCVRKG